MSESDDLNARMEKLSRAMAASNQKTEQKSHQERTDRVMGSAVSAGGRVLGEFVASVCVGALIGWQIDVWAGTSPFGLLIFVTLGMIAGFWSIYRVAAKPTLPPSP